MTEVTVWMMLVMMLPLPLLSPLPSMLPPLLLLMVVMVVVVSSTRLQKNSWNSVVLMCLWLLETCSVRGSPPLFSSLSS
jgi:hypothetical protein